MEKLNAFTCLFSYEFTLIFLSNYSKYMLVGKNSFPFESTKYILLCKLTFAKPFIKDLNLCEKFLNYFPVKKA